MRRRQRGTPYLRDVAGDRFGERSGGGEDVDGRLMKCAVAVLWAARYLSFPNSSLAMAWSTHL